MSSIRICPKCGTEVMNNEFQTQNFCPSCGQKLRDSDDGNINLVSAYKKMFKNYANFKGRSRRSEYWYAILANVLIIFAAYLFFVPAIVDIINIGEPSTVGVGMMAVSSIFIGLYSIAMIVPTLAIGVRRLHDVGKSGWFLFLSLIPYVGGIILFVFMVMDSQVGVNQYGSDPKNRQ